MDEKKREILLSKVGNITNVQYKNPSAYILGYLALNKGQIDKKRVKHIFNSVLPDFKEEGVTPPDVIRYARYWSLFL